MPISRNIIVALASLVTLTSSLVGQAPAPTGLAASALANENFSWVRSDVPGFRVYFLADSYPARHRDSLSARLPQALAHARELIEVTDSLHPIDLFFVESRPQMEALVGGRATGFAHTAARAVFVMTNPDWRAFEQHEIMHVVAVQSWGRASPGTDWLQEGLAQFADGYCGGYTNSDIAIALTRRHGWIPLEDVLARFRQQPDLRAYLQAAAFVKHLHERFGVATLQKLWMEGATPRTEIHGVPLGVIEERWRNELRMSRVPSDVAIERIEEDGCGVSLSGPS
jgi:hypothetical protein